MNASMTSPMALPRSADSEGTAGSSLLARPADPLEFEALACKHRTALFLRARLLTGSEHDADDLVQDTLIRALRARPNFQPGSNMYAWLMKIMFNLFLDHRRELRRRGARVPLPTDLPACNEPAVDLAEEPPLSLSAADLAAAVDQLPTHLRKIWHLRVRDGASYAVIAETLGMPVSTVGTRLLRARLQLRAALLANAGRGEAAPRKSAPARARRASSASSPASPVASLMAALVRPLVAARISG
jgi:RNA polymerase sigma-70 factor (ECF subfamily)